MRKQECIHLHALLAEVARHLEENEDMPAETLVEYDALDTRPLSVTQSKGEHCEAVLVLARAIGTWLERPPEERPDLTVS